MKDRYHQLSKAYKPVSIFSASECENVDHIYTKTLLDKKFTFIFFRDGQYNLYLKKIVADDFYGFNISLQMNVIKKGSLLKIYVQSWASCRDGLQSQPLNVTEKCYYS